MKKYTIVGGIPLKGEVAISGRKNSALKIIAAALLTTEEVTLKNVPEISDIHKMLAILHALGVEVIKVSDGVYKIKAERIAKTEVPRDLARKLAGSKVLMGALLSRLGEVIFPEYSGGCKIGKKRPINRHIEALEALGATASYRNGWWHLKGKLKSAVVEFQKNTVMGTENTLLASVLTPGETTLINAAQEPQIDDLVSLLTSMGANIKREPKDLGRIIINGVPKLCGTEHTIGFDEIEAGTFAVAAAVTRGDIVLKSLSASVLLPFLSVLDKVGVAYQSEKNRLRVWCEKERKLQPIRLETAPYPGFLTDWQPPLSVLLTQAEGESLIHETVWVNRLAHTHYLNRMGANLRLLTPSSAGFKVVISDDDYDLEKEGEPKTVAKITGPTPLHGADVKITDLRAGATLVVAALAASGRSRVFGVEYLKRGYERFEEKLKSLGARIETS